MELAEKILHEMVRIINLKFKLKIDLERPAVYFRHIFYTYIAFLLLGKELWQDAGKRLVSET